MQSVRGVLRALLGGAGSALLLALALPPGDWHVLGWFCMLPLFLSVRNLHPRFGFYGGFACLLLTALLAQSGILYREQWPEGETGWIWVGMLIFAFAPAIAATFWAGIKEPKPWTPWFLAAVAVSVEGALMVYLPGNIALTQHRAWPMLFLASLTGIWGVSFVVWFVNFALAQAIGEKRWGQAGLVAAGALALAAMALIPRQPETGDFVVGAVQTDSGFPQTLSDLNAEAGSLGAEVVVWPELSAISMAAKGKTESLIELASQPNQPPFVTSFQHPEGDKTYNAAALFSATGESARYFKRKPFGPESQEHAAGSEPLVVEAAGHRFGLAICFDTCFPHILRDLERSGQYDAILVPTLDPAAKHGVVQSIHAAWGPFRAAELGAPIIQADTTAKSQILDAQGLRLVQAGFGEQIITAGINPTRKWRLATVIGDAVLWLCVAGVLWGVYCLIATRRRASESDKLKI